MAVVVQKFGGSSVADAKCFERVADIMESQSGPNQAIVLSACKGVTDALLDLVSLAESQQMSWRERLTALRVDAAWLQKRIAKDDATRLATEVKS